jgi:hypothetical protein
VTIDDILGKVKVAGWRGCRRSTLEAVLLYLLRKIQIPEIWVLQINKPLRWRDRRNAGTQKE